MNKYIKIFNYFLYINQEINMEYNLDSIFYIKKLRS